MSNTRREITAVELATVFSLAATMPDLTVIPVQLAELASLRARVTRGESAIIALRASQLDLRDGMRRLGLARAAQTA